MTTLRGTLPSGGVLNKGDDVVSNNNRYQLVLQTVDGNLVLYDLSAGPPPARPLWSSNTPARGVETCTLSNGNLILTDGSGKMIWETGTQGSNVSYLNVQDDGNVVIYEPRPLWATGTVQS